jgi:hypothetical protein
MCSAREINAGADYRRACNTTTSALRHTLCARAPDTPDTPDTLAATAAVTGGTANVGTTGTTG